MFQVVREDSCGLGVVILAESRQKLPEWIVARLESNKCGVLVPKRTCDPISREARMQLSRLKGIYSNRRKQKRGRLLTGTGTDDKNDIHQTQEGGSESKIYLNPCNR